MNHDECRQAARQELTQGLNRYLARCRGRAAHAEVARAWIEVVEHAAAAMQVVDGENMIDLFAHLGPASRP